VLVIAGDDKVRECDWFEPGRSNLRDIAFEGGGGTDFTPLLREAERHAPDIGVFLTDLDGPADYCPRFPVLWAVPVPLEQMPRDAAGLGLHLHNNCESTRIDELVCTVQRLREARPDLLEGADWFNLGGGYLFDDARDTHRLREAVALLGADVSRPVFLEPGAALVQAAGFLVTSVTDCFRGDDGALMAILDTSVNHLPEVLEFQYQPRLAGIEPGRFRHSLAGASCLVGDLFGDYDLSAPLEPGARLTFLDAGSYSFVKSHMFNGINLPTLYSVTNEGDLLERRRFDYGDFLTRCGGPANAC
jgi:carboxynorspermidine decarboxylase